MKVSLLIILIISILTVVFTQDPTDNKQDQEEIIVDEVKKAFDEVSETAQKTDDNQEEQPEELDEDAALNEAIVLLGLDKKEVLNRNDFKKFIEFLMTKNENMENLQDNEKELVQFVVEKAVASVPEEFNKNDLKEIVTSDKLRRTLSEAVAEKLGINPDDLMGGQNAGGNDEQEDVNVDDDSKFEDKTGGTDL